VSLKNTELGQYYCTIAKQEWCNYFVPTLDWEVSNDFQDKWWYEVICFISAFGYMLLFLLIYFNKSLQVHPMPIVMMISLVGGSIYFTYIFGSNLCRFNLISLFAGSLTFQWGSSYYEYLAAVVLW
jgi:hypothetical protein